MCGISGLVTFRGEDKEKLLRGIEGMNRVQKLRGPDGEGSVVCSAKNSPNVRAAFGHRRLSIIDLSRNGDQPMKRGALTITFNGEIYNYRELKRELQAEGASFRTETDTEVILALFEREGERSFPRLRGMFAFALWDETNGSLYLVRDRFGIKPLYYGIHSDKDVIFASSVRAIEESGAFPLTKNHDAMIGFLLFGSVPLPLTTWREVAMVPEGCFIKIDGRGKETIVKYYSSLPFFIAPFEHREAYLAKTKEILQDSVGAHLISDAPLGVFLSGGLDSSAIAALAASERNKPLITLSVSFEEKRFSEEPYQRLVTEAIGSEHRNVKIRKSDFLEALPDALEAMDQPTIDGINTYFISRAAKETGLKAVLSGLGSDELFMGYPNFRRAGAVRALQSVPFVSFLSVWGGKYRKLSFLGERGILRWYLAFRGIFTLRETARIADVPEREVSRFLNALEERVLGDEVNSLYAMHPAQLLSYLEMKFYMQNQLLKDSDFMGMRHSIEIRVPFVDHHVVAHVAKMAPRVKLQGRYHKPVLVAAVRNIVPSPIYARKKMGFTFPFEVWMKEGGMAGDANARGVDIHSHWSREWALTVVSRSRHFS